MIAATGFKGDKVAVMGLARSGLAAAAALKAGGAEVLAWDDAVPKRDAARAAGIALTDLGQISFAGVRALVLSPGIPHTWPKPNPVAAAARAANVPIIGDIELLGRACPDATFVGITGTNGKSTTTALIAHILKAAGRVVQVGGNLGTPALTLARLGADGVYVLEMSSYQLELIDRLAFDVAVWLNLTPDHLDRHGGMAGYIAAKRRIFEHARTGRAVSAIIGVDDAPSRAVADIISQQNAWRLTRISVITQEKGGVSVVDGNLVDDRRGDAETVLNLTRLPRLPGRHNWQNVAAAYAATRDLGLAAQDIVAGIRSFPGLAHRQELIATIAGVRYVNDSKATNADATANALACYDDIYWIAGGIAKEGGIASLAPLFPRIRHAYLIGEAAPAFAATLGDAVPHTRSHTLVAALDAARDQAAKDGRPEPVVLLSPACASFDQFRDFEARGDAFRELVKAIPGAAR
jgi:UDP-N-acetylmuramoylalanine--D-glutamate ligase